jgi:hypothetical protein
VAGLRLDDLRRILRGLGCTKLLAKRLAQNDNSKQQVYLGGGFEAVTVIPTTSVSSAATKAREPRFFAGLDFHWIDRAGISVSAPNAQLILYPQYPEVRLSGFLRGYRGKDAELMRHERGRNLPDRILFLGIAGGKIHAHVCLAESALGQDLEALGALPQVGVFTDVPLDQRGSSREILLRELLRIHRLGWIDGKRIANGVVIPYSAQNGAGYTLEAELDVQPSGRATPDFLDWELKQHKVSSFDRLGGGRVTLMTPQPSGGMYFRWGAVEFVLRFGHRAASRQDRVEFTGIHRCGARTGLTGLTLLLRGYDAEKNRITDSSGGIVLATDKGEDAAVWPFADVIAHWNAKHAKTAYVPALHRNEVGRRSYLFGPVVRLGEGTDPLLLLAAMAAGTVYYDPGVNVSGFSVGRPKAHQRSQFRISAGGIRALYRSLVRVDLLSGAETPL